jgi:hypothetical protein
LVRDTGMGEQPTKALEAMTMRRTRDTSAGLDAVSLAKFHWDLGH